MGEDVFHPLDDAGYIELVDPPTDAKVELDPQLKKEEFDVYQSIRRIARDNNGSVVPKAYHRPSEPDVYVAMVTMRDKEGEAHKREYVLERS